MASTKKTITYTSSIDGLGPLHADLAYRDDAQPKPMLAGMHGFSNPRKAVEQDMHDLAALGFFCVAPDMRGQGDSPGTADCGRLAIADIVDGLGAAAAACPEDVDAGTVGIVGYSGGGGNAQSMLAKFPELCCVGASFFGISDYAAWYRSEGRVDCNRVMDRIVGGSPEALPLAYAAAASLPAIVNAGPDVRLHLFWDCEESGCPPFLNELVVARARAAGRPAVIPHVTGPGDANRWIHGYRSGKPQLQAADAVFTPDLGADRVPGLLPETGELVVCGYVVTTRFALWLGDGLRGQARVQYDDSGDNLVVSVVEELPGTPPLRVVPGPTLLDWYAAARTP